MMASSVQTSPEYSKVLAQNRFLSYHVKHLTALTSVLDRELRVKNGELFELKMKSAFFQAFTLPVDGFTPQDYGVLQR